MKWLPTIDIEVDKTYLFYNRSLNYIGIGKVLSCGTIYQEYMRWAWFKGIEVLVMTDCDCDESHVVILTNDRIFELTDDEVLEHVVLGSI